MTVTALIPLKALERAKGRLAGALDAGERRDLAVWMAQRVIAACHECTGIEEIIVIGGDEDAADVGRRAGAAAIVVPQEGLHNAMRVADAATADRLATLVVAADLPDVTPLDLHAVLDAAAGGAGVVIAPTQDGGTGALLRRPPGIITTAYGRGSAAAHLRLAEQAGAGVVLVHRHGLAADVDTPEQLAALARSPRPDVPCGPA